MRRAALVALAGLLVVGAAAAGQRAEPGLTATTILLGGTVPLSGEAAAFGAIGPGAKAFFDYVNARGGVHGRKIQYRFYDDAYNPAQTVQLTRKLVEQDRVFAIFNSAGTAQNLAVRDYLNAAKVPQLFVGDGSDATGRGGARYPWTLGFLQSYRGEGAIYGRDLVERRRGARVAILLENTELGKDMARGLSRAIAGKGPQVVSSEAYEFTGADVSSQVARLKASGADTLMLFATPKFAIQAIAFAHRLGWKPLVYIASVSIEPGIMSIMRTTAPELTKGALSVAFVKDPNDPIWARDPALALYRKVMRTHYPAGKPGDVYNWYGMTVAWTMVETLRAAGRSLTRAGLVKAARSLDLRNNPFLLPGIALRTSATVSFPIANVYLYRYDNRQWVRSSGLLPAR
jgi:ABC-type branched-subunit amino acid transport system substrate-binding protein